MVSGATNRQSKVSSTKDRLSKFKSFFKKSQDESSKKVNSSSVTDGTSVVYHETKPFSKVKNVQTTGAEKDHSLSDKFKSLFTIKKKDEQQPAGKKRKELFKKVNNFFHDRIVPAFQPSSKMKPLESELERGQYAVACKNFQMGSQKESIEKLTAEINQFEKHFQERLRQFNLESNPWDQDELALQQEEIELLNKLIHQKKSERKEQIKMLEANSDQLTYLKEQLDEQYYQEHLSKVQRIQEEEQKREQLIREKEQRREQLIKEKEQQEKQTELYKWQLDQIEKQKRRPKENERPTLHPTELNPWTVQKELQRDHNEQIEAWKYRLIFLQHTKPRVTMKEIRSGMVSVQNLHPWALSNAQRYEEEIYKMQVEMEYIMEQQRQEKLQLEKDAIKYIKAFWNTKTTIIGRTIRESEVTRQLITFNKKVGSHITSLYHRII